MAISTMIPVVPKERRRGPWGARDEPGLLCNEMSRLQAHRHKTTPTACSQASKMCKPAQHFGKAACYHG